MGSEKPVWHQFDQLTTPQLQARRLDLHGNEIHAPAVPAQESRSAQVGVAEIVFFFLLLTSETGFP